MKDGFAGSALIFAMASSSVPITLGLAGLSKPMWLSLICRKVSLLGWAASAPSMIPSESGTPPEIVHSTPVPAQVMHSNTFRRLTPAFLSLFVDSLMVVLRYSSPRLVVTGPRRDLFPDHRILQAGRGRLPPRRLRSPRF